MPDPFSEAGSSRFRSQNEGSGRSALRYPSPFFDVAGTYLPNTVQDLFKYCRYYVLTNPLVSAVVYKMALYPVTPIIFEAEEQGLKKKWDSLLHDDLRIKSFLVEANLDKECYGNSYISLFFPFVKWLICRHCKTEVMARAAKFRMVNFHFRMTCKGCGNEDDAKAEDRQIQDVKGIKLIRWDPESVDVDYNPITQERRYYYKMPRRLKNAITVGKRHIVANTPQTFIDAMRKRRAIVLSPDNLYHYRRSSISHMDTGLGVPRLLPVLKDVFYMTVLKKSQEAVAMGHIVPFRVLFPQPGTQQSDPYSNVSIGNWQEYVKGEISTWRQDPNYFAVMPLPVGFQNIGGDARSLAMHEETKVWAQHVVAGMGAPQEFIFGGLSYCLDLGSYVQTSRGLEQVREVVGEDTPHGNHRPAREMRAATHRGSAPISRIHRSRRKAARVQTSLGLDCSPSHRHRYRVLRRDLSMEWVPAEELRPGDRVAVRPGSALWPETPPDLSYAVQEAEKAYEGTRDMSQAYPVTLPDRLTPELARLLGYLTAEGSSDHRRFGFGQKDREVLDDFLHCTETVFGYRPSSYEQQSGCAQVEIGRRVAVRYLQALGVDGPSAEKEVPHCIRVAPKDLVSEYIKAYMEGDGGVDDAEEKQCVSATSQSEELLKVLQLMLLNFGVVSSRYPAYGDRCPSLQIRSEYVDRYVKKIGFVSPRKRGTLASRTPTGRTHIGERLPYVKEELDAFRERNFGGRSCWTFEPVSADLDQDWYTPGEVAELLGRDVSTVRLHIRKGRLEAELVPGVMGRFSGYRVSRESLATFLTQWGRGRRRSVPGRDAWGMTYSKLRSQDLSLIAEREPELLARIKELLEHQYVWDEVLEVDLFEEEVEMGDLTVDGDHSFLADGLVCHNSGSSVSMRMLENEFLRTREDMSGLVRFIVRRIASFMDWGEAEATMAPFKMADDLQRAAFDFQMNMAGKLSDKTLLSSRDYSVEDEQSTLRAEAKHRTAFLKETQVAQATAGGEAMLIQAKYQAQIQEMQQGAMALQQGQQPMDPAAQGGQPGQPGPGGAQPQNGAAPPQGIQSQIGMHNVQGGGGIDLGQQAQKVVDYMQKLDPQTQQAEMGRLAQENPQVHQLVLSMMNSQPIQPIQSPDAGPPGMPPGPPGGGAPPPPEQRPPRAVGAA